MTREEARLWIPLLKAYADGAEIEMNFGNNHWESWHDMDAMVLDYPWNYRVKPQDHARCVHNRSTNGGWAAANLSWEHSCDKEGFCKDFKEEI